LSENYVKDLTDKLGGVDIDVARAIRQISHDEEELALLMRRVSCPVRRGMSNYGAAGFGWGGLRIAYLRVVFARLSTDQTTPSRRPPHPLGSNEIERFGDLGCRCLRENVMYNCKPRGVDERMRVQGSEKPTEVWLNPNQKSHRRRVVRTCHGGMQETNRPGLDDVAQLLGPRTAFKGAQRPRSGLLPSCENTIGLLLSGAKAKS
jgi:hypothetical protein